MGSDNFVENKGSVEVCERRKSSRKVVAAEVEEETEELKVWKDVEKVVCRKHRQMTPSRLFEIVFVSN